MPRRSLFRAALALAVALFAVCLALAPRVHADAVAYPAGAPGDHARAFFAAYGSDEATMRAFWSANGSPAALATRPIDARIDVWRQLRAEQGTLTPESVLASGPDFATVRARNAHGQAMTIRFVCDSDAAHGLVALRIEDDTSAHGP